MEGNKKKSKNIVSADLDNLLVKNDNKKKKKIKKEEDTKKKTKKIKKVKVNNYTKNNGKEIEVEDKKEKNRYDRYDKELGKTIRLVNMDGDDISVVSLISNISVDRYSLEGIKKAVEGILNNKQEIEKESDRIKAAKKICERQLKFRQEEINNIDNRQKSNQKELDELEANLRKAQKTNTSNKFGLPKLEEKIEKLKSQISKIDQKIKGYTDGETRDVGCCCWKTKEKTELGKAQDRQAGEDRKKLYINRRLICTELQGDMEAYKSMKDELAKSEIEITKLTSAIKVIKGESEALKRLDEEKNIYQEDLAIIKEMNRVFDEEKLKKEKDKTKAILTAFNSIKL